MDDKQPQPFDFDRPECGFQAIRFDGERLRLLDQRRLPASEVWLEITSIDEAIGAIRDLVVRGAPAIGITAAYAAVIAARQFAGDREGWAAAMGRLGQARPTAVNLSWAVERMIAGAREQEALDPQALALLARRIHAEDIAANQAMAAAGSATIGRVEGVLTHCNTGSLATGGVGTALGVIISAAQAGQIAQVYADETRPWLQGSRLTAWELARAGIEPKVIVEGAAASLMASGRVQWVVVGADRIAANGDVANKIGTFGLAVLARHHGLKFMVVAPESTLDRSLDGGHSVAIEQRDAGEIWRAAGIDQAPAGCSAWNPVFDITPGSLIDCIVTERGIHLPPFDFAANSAE